MKNSSNIPPTFGLQFNQKNKQKPKAQNHMKKLFYVLMFALASGLAITSCTEEEVKPSTDNGGGGGQIDPWEKG
ncbi:MAG: hypothetical protein HC859_09760 [Bacteroidia bacterium]|nr:hypothetical protein [Bacteroidia bacterium]